MKKLITAIMIVAVVLAAMALPVEASEKWVTKTFNYGSIAPVVQFRVEGLGEKYITVKSDGFLASGTKAKAKTFVILPSKYDVYYIIRDAENPYLSLTYTSKGFKMMTSPDNGYGMPEYQPTQMFKFAWKINVSQGYNNRKCNGWKFICKQNNMTVPVSGYNVFGLWQMNAR